MDGFSFHNSVYDQIIGVVDYTNLFILGITCAMAWQLPHEPFDEDFLRKQFEEEDDIPPKRRNDENITDVPVIENVDRNYNSLDTNSWNKFFKDNNATFSTSWDDSSRFVFAFIGVIIIKCKFLFLLEKSFLIQITSQLENQLKSIWSMRL